MDDSALGPPSVLVPVQSVAHVTANAIVLDVDRATATQLPGYHEDDHGVPGRGWQPSFDYCREDVRFAVGCGSTHLADLASADLASRRRAWIGTPRG